jgi:hypothetical protein
MAFSLSPAVSIREIDLSTIVPAVATSITAVAGAYQKGPCFEKKLVTNEDELKQIFGLPTDNTADHWFSASNFLAYSNTLYVCRAVDSETAINSGVLVEDSTGTNGTLGLGTYIPNDDAVDTYTASFSDYVELTLGTDEAGTFKIGETVTGGTSSATGDVVSIDTTAEVITVQVDSGTFGSETITGDVAGSGTATAVNLSETAQLQVYAKYPGSYGDNLQIAIANATDFDTAEITAGVNFVDYFEYAPAELGTDYFAVVVLDEDEQILETFLVSSDPTAKKFDGTSEYVETLINRTSNYITVFFDSSNTNEISSITATSLVNGNDGLPTTGDIQLAYDEFDNAEEFDVNLIIDGGNVDATIQKYIIAMCESRMDCMAILGVPRSEVVGIPAGTATTNCATYKKDTLDSASSYGAIYGNFKYQYDKFNDVYRWVPISGDVAGIYARTDDQRDPWFAPAGLNRGQIKNVVKLAFNPNRAQRDTLYKSQVNPIVSLASDGPVVFGQKTLQAKPSAFDRVNVRRLFIIIEKAIATSSKYFLFEQNNAYTRRQLVGMIEPYLRNVQGRQGITDFFVQCDETNNTPQVIDSNQLVCSIFVAPTRATEYLQLNFIASRTGVEFSEIVGSV